jgi:DNA-binding beta-propeller fold protein YncE
MSSSLAASPALSRLCCAALVLLLAGCSWNHPPETPSVPEGPSEGFAGGEYEFSAASEDPDGDTVYIRFHWGNNDTTDWLLASEPGAKVTGRYSWGAFGLYAVRAQARDEKGAASCWSETHHIAVASGGYPHRVVAKIPVGSDVYGIAVSAEGRYLYAGHVYEPRVTVLDCEQREVAATVRLGERSAWSSRGRAIPIPGQDVLYATYYKDDWVAVIETKAYTVCDSIPGFVEPNGMTVPPGGRFVYVAAWLDDSDSAYVGVIRTQDNTVVDSIVTAEYYPFELLAALPGGDYVYGAAKGDRYYWGLLIRTADNVVADTVELDIDADDLTVSPDGKRVYAVGRDIEGYQLVAVSVPDNEVVARVDLDTPTWRVAVVPDGKHIYLAGDGDRGETMVRILRSGDHATVRTVAVSGNPGALAAHPGGRFVYVAAGDTVFVLGI